MNFNKSLMNLVIFLVGVTSYSVGRAATLFRDDDPCTHAGNAECANAGRYVLLGPHNYGLDCSSGNTACPPNGCGFAHSYSGSVDTVWCSCDLAESHPCMCADVIKIDSSTEPPTSEPDCWGTCNPGKTCSVYHKAGDPLDGHCKCQ